MSHHRRPIMAVGKVRLSPVTVSATLAAAPATVPLSVRHGEMPSSAAFLDALSRIGQTIRADGGLTAMLARIVRLLVALPAVSHAWVFLPGARDGELTLAAYSGDRALRHRTTLTGHANRCADQLRTGEASIACSTDSVCTALCRELVDDRPAGCTLNVVLPGRQGGVGMLNLAGDPTLLLAPAFQQFLQAVREPIGIAIERAVQLEQGPIPSALLEAGDLHSLQVGMRWLEQAKSVRDVQARLPYLKRLVRTLRPVEVAPSRVEASGTPVPLPVAPGESTAVYDGGRFTMRLPSSWQPVAKDRPIDGKRVRLLARALPDADGQSSGGVQVVVETALGRSLDTVLRETRSASEAGEGLFVWQSDCVGADGRPNGFTGIRQQGAHTRYETVLIVPDGLSYYVVQVFRRVGQAAAGADLEVARSFQLV